MVLKESWVFVLLGNNNTGKTTFQKKILYKLFGWKYDKLPSKKVHVLPAGYNMHETIFIMGRSLQEWLGKVTVPGMFKNDIEEADIVVLSSHVDDSYGCMEDIRQMIEYGHLYGYNVCAIMFENSDRSTARYQSAMAMPWDKRIYFVNPRTSSESRMEAQLEQLATEFIEYIKC